MRTFSCATAACGLVQGARQAQQDDSLGDVDLSIPAATRHLILDEGKNLPTKRAMAAIMRRSNGV